MVSALAKMPLYLRVKRLRSDVPVESFEAGRLSKLSKLESNENYASTFRYVGSQSSESDIIDENNLEKLQKLDPKGSFKLQWNSTSGRIFGKGVSSVPCAVRINSLKRSLSVVDSDSDSTVPVKVMRIIDITPDQTKDDLSHAFHGSTTLNASEIQTVEIDYVYDLYCLEKRRKAVGHNRSSSPFSALRQDSNPESLSPLYTRDEIVYDQDSRDDGEQIYADDDDDSNSESNWRNDYPDEEDVSTTGSSSCSDDSDNRSDSDVSHSYYQMSQYDRF
ncbi:hypothetical protein FGIG_10766 [Fasciola gigantica]|uniref:Probable RNA polymerase II nuclear localization protein SLC7A6OS n=1 Tax=Fasciola gigantica TaxID=46835 RepID=A0A504YQF9_FASGI|nr:hypothetical protein FGIG_10766 [Fasciola gigantica]